MATRGEPLAASAPRQHPSFSAGSALGSASSADVLGKRGRARGWAEQSAACDSAGSATPPRAPAPPAPPGASFPGSRRAPPPQAVWVRARLLRLFLRPPRSSSPRPSASGHAAPLRELPEGRVPAAAKTWWAAPWVSTPGWGGLRPPGPLPRGSWGPSCRGVSAHYLSREEVGWAFHFPEGAAFWWSPAHLSARLPRRREDPHGHYLLL